MKFIAEIDRTASYIVLSNIETKVFYVLQVTNPETDESVKEKQRNGEQKMVNKKKMIISFITEFPLSSSILSFSIIDATLKKYKCSSFNESSHIDDMEDYDDENAPEFCIVIRTMIIQPKSVQECSILYQPPLESVDPLINFSLNLDNVSESASVSEEEEEEEEATETNVVTEIDQINDSFKSATQISLMAPEAFSSVSSSNSGGKKTPENVSSEVLSTILKLAGATGTKTVTCQDNINLLNLVNNKIIEEQQQQKQQQNGGTPKTAKLCDQLISGGSSPSREVEEIMHLQEAHKEKPQTDGNKNTSQVKSKEESKDENQKSLSGFQMAFPTSLLARTSSPAKGNPTPQTVAKDDEVAVDRALLSKINDKLDLLIGELFSLRFGRFLFFMISYSR